MIRFLLPLLLLLAGTGGGIGAGLFLAPVNASDAATRPSQVGERALAAGAPEAEAGRLPARESEYVKLSNQFIVPVVENARVSAMMVLGLSVEVPEGLRESVFEHEPKLRDALLRALFDHANIGGFGGNFTSSSNMRLLQESLRDAAQGVLGSRVSDVLIADIVRQEV